MASYGGGVKGGFGGGVGVGYRCDMLDWVGLGWIGVREMCISVYVFLSVGV